MIIRKLIRLFVPTELLSTHWHRFIKTKSTTTPQQTNFTGKLKESNYAIMFFIAEKQQKTISKLKFRFIRRNRII